MQESTISFVGFIETKKATTHCNEPLPLRFLGKIEKPFSLSGEAG
jgi:hypothetical protein